MNHYLLIYNRRKGEILFKQEFPNRIAALDERFKAERDYSSDQDIEVVVLGAGSWEALRRTHARYFRRVGDLASSALEEV